MENRAEGIQITKRFAGAKDASKFENSFRNQPELIEPKPEIEPVSVSRLSLKIRK